MKFSKVITAPWKLFIECEPPFAKVSELITVSGSASSGSRRFAVQRC